MPSSPPPGPLERATLLLLQRAALTAGELTTVLIPHYGLEPGGAAPPSAGQIEHDSGVGRDRQRYLRRTARALAQQCGTPTSLDRVLVSADAAGVITAPDLSAHWQAHGLTDGLLHPAAVLRICSLFGADPTFTVPSYLGGRRLVVPLVVTPTLERAVDATGRALWRDLAAARFCRVDELEGLAAGVTGQQARAVLVAAGGLVAGEHVVDPQPGGVDSGLIRALSAAEGPVPVEALLGALVRWARESRRHADDWDAASLATYTRVSPLYDVDFSGGVVLSASCARHLTDRDRDLLDHLKPGGGPTRRGDLIDGLTRHQHLTARTAAHLVAVSPVITPVGRGLYQLLGGSTAPTSRAPQEGV